MYGEVDLRVQQLLDLLMDYCEGYFCRAIIYPFNRALSFILVNQELNVSCFLALTFKEQ